MGRVEGKVAIVTGGSTRLGQAIAALFAREGARVAVIDSKDGVTAPDLTSAIDDGGIVRKYRMEALSEEEVKRVCAEVFKEFGRVDILINNATVTDPPLLDHEISSDEWRRLLDVDASGISLCTKHAIPFLKESGAGSIINLSSGYGMVRGRKVPPPSPYHAAKARIRYVSRADAARLAPDKIRVNSLHPGLLWTRMLEESEESAGGASGRPPEKRPSELPLGQDGEPIDIAYAALYLASDEARFVSGAELIVDGGYSAWRSTLAEPGSKPARTWWRRLLS